jgi:hypothetical protein
VHLFLELIYDWFREWDNAFLSSTHAASQPGLSAASQAALTADFAQMCDQITNVVANASFDGANMEDAHQHLPSHWATPPAAKISQLLGRTYP